MENFFAKSALLFIIAQHKYSFQVVPRNMETCKIANNNTVPVHNTITPPHALQLAPRQPLWIIQLN